MRFIQRRAGLAVALVLLFGGAGVVQAVPTQAAASTEVHGTGLLPSSFRWSSTGMVVSPKSHAAHDLVAIKDPSVVHCNGRWHVFASTVDKSGNYSMVYLNFTDWSKAGSTTCTRCRGATSTC
ncbi:non-reducing end alpha-L-arabinofuranosidase family hydrolase [Kutzneria kofuensis]|uniref:non-reducing end alpha-L-arabinofuranosidase n=1 Tax=Kutzneria kofuensis TaxID=103725 RepID=A0A7W9KPH3_9PSEU|nr:non-reducing end alpha-L-arabinofuranosidase family hydrolase [Kutzneria kofuensis]MBB5896340.1 hypothetical protein [Kutzneria kofuensis]